MKIQNVLFDLDGTLTDSSPGIVNSIQYALDKMGIQEHDTQKLTSFVGPSLYKTFSENYFPTEAEVKQAMVFYREYFAETGIFENALYTGVPELLESLKSEGKKIALATAKPTFFAKIILQHFHINSYFDVVIGSHLTGTRTEKKEIIHEVKDQLGLPLGENCVMIGDREYDIIGGKHHEMRTIGVSYGYAKSGELDLIQPDFIVHSPLEIQTLFNQKVRL